MRALKEEKEEEKNEAATESCGFSTGSCPATAIQMEIKSDLKHLFNYTYIGATGGAMRNLGLSGRRKDEFGLGIEPCPGDEWDLQWQAEPREPGIAQQAAKRNVGHRHVDIGREHRHQQQHQPPRGGAPDLGNQ